MMNTIKKYHVERIEQAVATDPEPLPNQTTLIQLDQYVQVDLDTPQANTSKLSSAHDLLRQLNISESLCSRCEEHLINTSHTEPKETKRNNPTTSTNQQVSNEIVKLAKEISGLKR